MKVSHNMELGEFYKELRIARQIKQKEVAHGNLTASQLSKFEQGKAMLSADRLYKAVEGINMTFSEFGHALNNYEDSPFLQLGNRISQLFSQQDILGLENLYDDLDDKRLYNRLMGIIIKNAIYSLDINRPLSEKDISILATYLYEVENWTAFELYLFSNTTSVLPSKDLIFLANFLLQRTTLYQSLGTNQRLFKSALINVISTLLEQKELQLIEFYIAQLRKWLTYEDVFFTISLEFLEKVYFFITSDSVSLEDIRTYLEQLTVIKNELLLNVMKLKLEQYLNIYQK